MYLQLSTINIHYCLFILFFVIIVWKCQCTYVSHVPSKQRKVWSPKKKVVRFIIGIYSMFWSWSNEFSRPFVYRMLIKKIVGRKFLPISFRRFSNHFSSSMFSTFPSPEFRTVLNILIHRKRQIAWTKMAFKKFALVWWLQSKETSMIPLTSVLPKKNRCVNAIVKLQWKGQPKMLQAKIMSINGKWALKSINKF